MWVQVQQATRSVGGTQAQARGLPVAGAGAFTASSAGAGNGQLSAAARAAGLASLVTEAWSSENRMLWASPAGQKMKGGRRFERKRGRCRRRRRAPSTHARTVLLQPSIGSGVRGGGGLAARRLSLVAVNHLRGQESGRARGAAMQRGRAAAEAAAKQASSSAQAIGLTGSGKAGQQQRTGDWAHR